MSCSGRPARQSVDGSRIVTLVMTMLTVSKSVLKVKLLEYLREIEASGEEVLITDRGVPVARIVPVRLRRPVHETFADVRGQLRWTGDPDAPTIDEWRDP
jgi:prevent-host-death family protein